MSDLNENKKLNTTDEIDTEATAEKPTKRRFSDFIDYVELFVFAVCVVMLLFSFVFRTCNVDGDSMNNTLFDKETLIISDLAYTPKRGDIVVFHQTGTVNMPLVKRVIGVGGDTVTVNVNTWEVSVTDSNGNVVELDEAYIHIDEHRVHQLAYKNNGVHTFVVPDGTVFVLGDNRNNSMDSTDMYNVGYVDCDRILGKVIFRISPLSRLGTVD